MAGSAVITTSASSATMKKATDVSSNDRRTAPGVGVASKTPFWSGD